LITLMEGIPSALTKKSLFFNELVDRVSYRIALIEY
jgi:hypothetical protein